MVLWSLNFVHLNAAESKEEYYRNNNKKTKRIIYSDEQGSKHGDRPRDEVVDGEDLGSEQCGEESGSEEVGHEEARIDDHPQIHNQKGNQIVITPTSPFGVNK